MSCLRLDVDSFRCNLCLKEDQVMVFGWHCTQYIKIFDALEWEAAHSPSFPIKKVFNWRLGNSSGSVISVKHNPIVQVGRKKSLCPLKNVGQISKAALTNVALHNVRYPDDKICVIFCIEHDVPYFVTPPATPAELLIKGQQSSSRLDPGRFDPEQALTSKELRRAYKLCTDPEVPESIRLAAREMCCFVRVHVNKVSYIFELVRINPPWESPDWVKSWEQRMKMKNASRPSDTFCGPKPSWRD